MANVFEEYRKVVDRRREALKEAYDGITGIIQEVIPERLMCDLDLYFPDGKIDMVINEEDGSLIINCMNEIEISEVYSEVIEEYAMQIAETYPGIKFEGKATIYLKEEKIALWMTRDVFEGYIEGEYENSLESLLEDFEKVYKGGAVYVLDNHDSELYIKSDSFVTVISL